MNVKSVVENKEKYEVELTIEVGQEEFEAGLEKAYRKNRSSRNSTHFISGRIFIFKSTITATARASSVKGLCR